MRIGTMTEKVKAEKTEFRFRFRLRLRLLYAFIAAQIFHRIFGEDASAVQVIGLFVISCVIVFNLEFWQLKYLRKRKEKAVSK